jgi:hypothetical protein
MGIANWLDTQRHRIKLRHDLALKKIVLKNSTLVTAQIKKLHEMLNISSIGL